MDKASKALRSKSPSSLGGFLGGFLWRWRIANDAGVSSTDV